MGLGRASATLISAPDFHWVSLRRSVAESDVDNARLRSQLYLEIDIEPTRVVVWLGCGFLGFKGASIIVRDAYGDTYEDDASFVAASGVSSLVEIDDNWNLSDVPLSRSAEGC